jgi:hypothetical protein
MLAPHGRGSKERSFAVEAVQRVGVGVADSGGHYLDQDFTGLRAVEVKFDDFERFLGLESDSGACLHSRISFSLSEPQNIYPALRLFSFFSFSMQELFRLGIGVRFVFVLGRRVRPTASWAGAIDIEVVHVAGDIGLSKRRHDGVAVFAAASHHAEEVAVTHGLDRVLQPRRVGRPHPVGTMTDMAFRVITAITGISVPVHVAVGDLEGRLPSLSRYLPSSDLTAAGSPASSAKASPPDATRIIVAATNQILRKSISHIRW